MLSKAKHLHFLIENKQLQILRCAQDDTVIRLFPQPVKPRPSNPVVRNPGSGRVGIALTQADADAKERA
jgi:hypothetical protein